MESMENVKWFHPLIIIILLISYTDILSQGQTLGSSPLEKKWVMASEGDSGSQNNEFRENSNLGNHWYAYSDVIFKLPFGLFL